MLLLNEKGSPFKKIFRRNSRAGLLLVCRKVGTTVIEIFWESGTSGRPKSFKWHFMLKFQAIYLLTITFQALIKYSNWALDFNSSQVWCSHWWFFILEVELAEIRLEGSSTWEATTEVLCSLFSKLHCAALVFLCNFM